MDKVLERLPAGFLRVRDDGVVLAANKTLSEMLGYAPGAVDGASIESLLSLPGRIFYQTHLFPLLKIQGRVDEVYVTLRTNSGDGFPVLLNALAVPGDGESEYLVIPIHNRDKYEAEILRSRGAAEAAVEQSEALRAALEDLVRQRTSELKQLVDELGGLSYSIAHNLRAPMRAILSTSAILHAEYSEALSADHAELLTRQRTNVETLNSMINDVLELFRLGTRSPEKQEVDVSSLVDHVATTAISGRESEFNLAIQSDITAWADPNMMAMLVERLVSNAVKYSPNGGTIEFGSRRDGSETVLFFRDEGIGMEPQYLRRIFESFERLHREEFPGNGIGLAIVARVVRHHGGRVWAESELGHGATFCFVLPTKHQKLPREATDSDPIVNLGA